MYSIKAHYMINQLLRLIYRAKNPIDIVNEYNIPSHIRFHLQTKDGSIIATSPDLPGFITEARNPESLREMINDGILTYFDVPRRTGDVVYTHMTFDGYGTVSFNGRMQPA